MERAAEALGTLANGWAGVRGRARGRPAGSGACDGRQRRVHRGRRPSAFARCAGLDSPDGRRCGRRRTASRPALGPPTADAVDDLRTLRFVSASAARCDGTARRGACLEARPRSRRWRRLTPPLRSSSSRRQTTRERGHVRLQAAESLSPYTTTTRSSEVPPHRTTGDCGSRPVGRPRMGPRHRATRRARRRGVRPPPRRAPRGVGAALGRPPESTSRAVPDDELAARFAVFHLLASALGDGEVAVGARGLTGPAYGGHVFWDADVFVLPALAAIRPGRRPGDARVPHPPPARGAGRGGRQPGRRGARFPWESADDGSRRDPASVRRPARRGVPIRTGEQEEHIVADVAWAA